MKVNLGEISTHNPGKVCYCFKVGCNIGNAVDMMIWSKEMRKIAEMNDLEIR